MEVTFKWNIGDTVTHKLQRPPTSVFDDPARLIIVGRVFEECPGGAQKHYRCRVVWRREVSAQLIQVHEEELIDEYPAFEDKSA